jgi:hypothetical protein
VEPYPQLIAGTPSGWGFVTRTRTFTLRYSALRAGSRLRFAPGSITQIATPGRIYPHGYAARVRGGAILSGPHAELLQIATPGRIYPHGYAARVRDGAILSGPHAEVLQIAVCPHAATVSVTVTPGADRARRHHGHPHPKAGCP